MPACSRFPGARLSVLSLALLAAFAPAWAQTSSAPPAPAAAAAEAPVPTGPVSEISISVGLGAIGGNRQNRLLFDQYNGLRPSAEVFGQFDAEYYRRDDVRGTSVQFDAVDLLTGNRELSLDWRRQGDWKLSAEYRELMRRETLTVNSGLVGAGTSSPVVVPLLNGPGSGGEFDLKTKRTGLGVAFSKVLSRDWQFDASLKTEDKDGARLFGIGMACPSPTAPGCGVPTGTSAGSAVLLLPEPINSNHTQAEGRVSYAGEKLRLSAGYYGSFYRNANGSLTPVVPGSLYNPLGVITPLSAGLQGILGNPVALPPDNQAHQLDLAGSYSLSRTTLLNFKVAYSLATQNDNFNGMGLTGAPAGRADLDGRLATKLVQVGLTARPLPKLSVSGHVRYEDRDDSTPIAAYNIEGTSVYTNRRLPLKRASAKAQGHYQFTSDWRGTLGVDVQTIDRGEFTPTSAVGGITALRQKTDETGVRAELRHTMSESLSGALSVESRRRDGSHWLRDNSGVGVTEVVDPSAPAVGFSTGIFSPTLADRKRDKVRLYADWQPSEELALQLSAEGGRDRFESPSSYGLRRAGMSQVSLDWTYALSSKWGVNGYVSHGRQQIDQSRPGAAIIDYDNKATTLGIGFTGKPIAKLEVGGLFAFIDDRNAYQQTLDATANAGTAALLAATGGLPDIVFRQTSLKLFGKYTLDKQSAVRVEFIYQRSRWSDWAWGYNGTPFVLSDGATVDRKQTQNVSFVGVSYIHRWP